MAMVRVKIKLFGTLDFDPREQLSNYMKAGTDFTEVYLDGADPDTLTDGELAEAMVQFDFETDPDTVKDDVIWDYSGADLAH